VKQAFNFPIRQFICGGFFFYYYSSLPITLDAKVLCGRFEEGGRGKEDCWEWNRSCWGDSGLRRRRGMGEGNQEGGGTREK
jgi:hypothetical protein